MGNGTMLGAELVCTTRVDPIFDHVFVSEGPVESVGALLR